jgi:putative membrane protein
MTDLILAIFHHLLVFALLAVLTYELAMVRVGMAAKDIAKVSRVDAVYGILAALILVVGFLRVFYGAKGPAFYLENPIFWAKIIAFLVVGLLSIWPTLRLIAWRNRIQREPAFLPSPAEIKNVRLFMRLEGTVFILIPIFAAMMARGYGL